MKLNPYRTGTPRILLTAGILVTLLAGCTVVGPTVIRNGRLAYNDAITETNNQQLLMAVIHNRYDERGSLLAVSSVTANVRVTTGTDVQLGFGDSDNYAGNLVPLGAGIIYEDNPTISYTPVEGEQYATRLFSPVPVYTLAHLAGTLSDPAYIYTTLVASVNGIRNPDFLVPPTQADPRFQRFVSLMTTLSQAHRLRWFGDRRGQGSFSIIIDHYAPAYTAEVNELLELLGLPGPKNPSTPVILPVSLAMDGRPVDGIGVITRSVWNLVEMLSAAVEVPAQDQQNGIAAIYPPAGPAGEELHIRRSKDKPRDTAVAVKYRDGWSYIDETDGTTKRFFRLMGTLWSVTIAESSAGDSASPVLTVPVSR